MQLSFTLSCLTVVATLVLLYPTPCDPVRTLHVPKRCLNGENSPMSMPCLFTLHRISFTKCSRKSLACQYLTLLLLVISHDVETNPGPGPTSITQASWNCGICDKPCGWENQAVACDECGKWYHIDCQGITTRLYNQMGSGFSWSCLQCGLPNVSSALFDISSLNSSNQFSCLDDDSVNTSSTSTPGQPLASSTPSRKQQPRKKPYDEPPLRVLVVNCESLRSQSKRSLFENKVNITKPHTILGTESWLDSSFSSSEVFTDNFTVFRKYRYEVVNRNVLDPWLITAHIVEFLLA